MRRAWGALFLPLGLAGCPESAPCVSEVPTPMTPARARALVPGLETGLAVSTALDLGPCTDALADTCVDGQRVCGPRRWAMRVAVFDASSSLPLDTSCPTGLSAQLIEDARDFVVASEISSQQGEWAAALPAGSYLLGFGLPSEPCLECPGGAAGDCVVDVSSEQVTTLALVL